MPRIYVADDDADMRNLLTLCLIEEGHEVLVAKDGEAALESLIEDPPDLLVLDIMMPKMNGFQVLEGLASYGLRESVKVLVLTARGAEADRVNGLLHGADRYLAKPFNQDEFRTAVKTLLAASNEELTLEREQELEKARLLATLEAVFEGPQPG
jgi:DNA-binding response OmpR family regulator